MLERNSGHIHRAGSQTRGHSVLNTEGQKDGIDRKDQNPGSWYRVLAMMASYRRQKLAQLTAPAIHRSEETH